MSPNENVLAQLREEQLRAHRGDARSARRVAELFELLHDEEEAAAWWLLAAGLGDADAADYVTGVLAHGKSAS